MRTKSIFLKLKIIIITYIITFVIILMYLLTLPSIYKVSVDLEVGYKSDVTGAIPIESLDNLVQKYSSRVNLKHIKKTTILQVTAESEDLNKAKKNLSDITDEIITEHNLMLGNTLNQNLNVRNKNNEKNNDLFLYKTKTISEVSIKKIPYLGVFPRGVILLIIISALISFIVAYIDELIDRRNLKIE